MSDEPLTTPDAAEGTTAPPAEVDGPLSIQDTLGKLREGGISAFQPEGESDEPIDAQEPDGADDPGVSGGDVSDDEVGDDGSAEGGDAEQDDAVPDADTGDEPDSDTVGADGDEDETGDDTDAKLTVEIPGRREGETVEIEVADPELAERLRQLSNDAMRRAEFNNQMESVRTAKAEIKNFQDRLVTDPTGLVLEKATPETREQLVRDILLNDPALLTKTLEQFNEIESDPYARTAAVAQMERDAAVRAREVDRLAVETAQYLEAATEITGAVEALIPEGTPDEVAAAFLEDAYGFLEFKAEREGPAVVNAANIRNLLETRLQLHGLGAASGTSDGSKDGAAQPALPKVALKKATPAEAAQAAQEGKKLVTRSEQRKGTVTAPAGSGAATTQFNPPKEQNVKERIAWLKKNHPSM